MLQIISIYKATDFAPLFVTVTTAEQYLLDSIYIKWLEWCLSDTQITTNNLKSEFARSSASWL